MKASISIFFLVLLFAALLYGCNAVDNISADAQGKQAEWDAIPLASPTLKAQSSPTLEPTATVTPWYDLAATQVAIDAINAQAAAAQAEKDKLILQMTKDAADVENRLRLEESARKDAELKARIELAQSYATATQQATNHAHEIELQKVAIETRNTGMKEIAVWTGIVLVIIAFFVVMIKLWRSAAAELPEQEMEEEPVGDIAHTPLPAGFVNISPHVLRPSNVPVPDKAFTVWAMAMLEGATAGENKWTTADSPFTSTTYPPFLEWAEAQGYVEGEIGFPKLLTEEGKIFCTNWLIRRGTPPPLMN